MGALNDAIGAFYATVSPEFRDRVTILTMSEFGRTPRFNGRAGRDHWGPVFSVALAVAAVPEGLPAVLTVSLSAGARRLAQRHAVARRMSAVEKERAIRQNELDTDIAVEHKKRQIQETQMEARAAALRKDLDAMTSAMAAAGYRVHSAVSFADTEAVFATASPDVVLADVQLPDVEGDDLCARLKMRSGTLVPVILMSNLPEVELSRRAAAVRADAFVSKRHGAAHVVGVVDALLDELVL